MIFAKLKDELKQIRNRADIDSATWQAFWNRLSVMGVPLTKNEGTGEHFCSFFVPVHRNSGSVFLIDHKKAGDWLPPGGHVEPDEDPETTVRREFSEELGIFLNEKPVSFFNISVTEVNRPEIGCLRHFDLWYFVPVGEKHDFKWDRGEFNGAGWFSLKEGALKIAHNPHCRRIVEGMANLIPNGRM